MRRTADPAVAVEVVATFDDLDAAEWDELAAAGAPERASFYLSARWLSFVEQDRSATARYVLIRHRDRLVGALPLYQVHAEENEAYRPERVLDGWGSRTCLLAGPRRGYVNGLLAATDLAPPEQSAVRHGLLAAVDERVRATDGVDAACFLYLDTTAAAALAAAPGCSIPQLVDADAWLPLPGTTFEDYLAGLSAQARTNCRHESRTFAAAGLSLELTSIGQCWAEAGPLLGQVQRRYGHGGSDQAYRAALARHAELLDDLSVVVAARRGGRLVAFALFYQWRDSLNLRMVGFDYDALPGAFEYFTVAFYEPIRYAYANGLRRIQLGRESYQAKVRRGGRLRPLWAVLRADPATAPTPGAGAADTRRGNARRLAGLQRQLSPSWLTGAEWTRWQE